MNCELIKPYTEQGEKSKQVEAMFNNIAPTYDTLNHTLAWNIDRGWRRKSIDRLKPFKPQQILDIATGTGDFAILAAKRLQPNHTQGGQETFHIMGADLSEGMMKVAQEKVKQEGLADVISFQKEDCLHLSFEDNTFDAVTVAYGARNFQDLDAGLREMRRVLKPEGHLLLVELTTPPHFPMRQLFWLYSHVYMRLVGRIISHDDSAYRYLPDSMAAFPQAEEMEGILSRAGYNKVEWHRYLFGLCTMYLAGK